jgi:hypothetical protein
LRLRLEKYVAVRPTVYMGGLRLVSSAVVLIFLIQSKAWLAGRNTIPKSDGPPDLPFRGIIPGIEAVGKLKQAQKTPR